MTRKDYILLANALRVASKQSVENEYYGGTVSDGVELAAKHVATALGVTNPKFDYGHFLAVVRGEKELHSKPAPKTINVKIMAVSDNTNSFGLHSVILFTEDGNAWRTYSSQYNKPTVNRVYQAAVNFEGRPMFDFIAKQGWEGIESLPKPSAKVFKAAGKF